jgi:short-subunit dehydrogenase
MDTTSSPDTLRAAPGRAPSTGEKTRGSTGRVLITGASGGIGYELAKLFAQDKHDLVLVSRNGDKLEEVARELKAAHGARCAVFAGDLAVPGSPDALYAEIKKSSIDIDVLVNNAGFGALGAFYTRPLREQLDMIQLNVTSLAHLTRLFLPEMVARKRGRIVNIASIAAYQPGPFMAVYYASKAFVVSFSEGIANELHGTGVTVTAICPGPTTTGFGKRAGAEKTTLFRKGMTMDAATVARIGYDGMKKNKTIVITGGKNKLLALGGRLAPRSLTANIARSLNEPRNFDTD